MVCTDDSTDSRCNDIHLGYGAPGTIIQMPEGCGPGRYAVVKTLELSQNQSLPHHLSKRSFGNAVVLDLTFDYDFRRVPRDFGDSQMRIDFSNEEGYWDSVVNRPGQKKAKRDMTEFRANRKRWLEDEWRDAYHSNTLSRDELHKRWFGSDVLSWLANLIGVGQAQITEELHHTVDETLSVILIDQQFNCHLGPANAQANVRATLDAHVEVDTSFGLTIIATLAFPPDLSQSFLYFKNKGQITAKFQLDAVATISYSSGDIKMIGLDDFPGATFRVPGIVTVGPNIAVYASADAAVSVSGHLESAVNIAKWEIQQTYPQTAQYPATPLDPPNRDGTSEIGVPTFDYSVSATGEITLHLKPVITFGIVFDSRWKVDRCAVDLVLDGFMIFHAQAGNSSQSDNSCPFSYGVDAGSRLYAQFSGPSVFGWGGNQQIQLAPANSIAIVPESCPAQQSSTRLVRSVDVDISQKNASLVAAGYVPGLAESLMERSISPRPELLGAPHDPRTIWKRDTFSLGPLITIPSSFLSCPAPSDDVGLDACPICSSLAGQPLKRKVRRDNGATAGAVKAPCPWCPPPSDDACTDNTVQKRADTAKSISLSWGGTFTFSRYPACSSADSDSVNGVRKWFSPSTTDYSPVVTQYRKDAGQNTVGSGVLSIGDFATDHVFEVQFISAFLEWLCNTNVQPKYGGTGTVPFPPGWGRPDTTWCADVFGTSTSYGFTFTLGPNDPHPNSFVLNSATKLGSSDTLNLLAVALDAMNGLKGTLLGGDELGVGGKSVPDMIRLVKNTAGIFSYLKNGIISPMFTNPGNGVEAVADFFDQAFWPNAAGKPGTPLTRPPPPAGVTHWGLRTLWCWWIDNHLARIEKRMVPNFLQAASTELGKSTQGSSNAARNFLSTYMNGNGLATAGQMTFPHDLQYANIPTPGQPNSATTTTSKYQMWGMNNFGPLGV